MTTRETPWPEGTPCWVDLAVDDFDKARTFYSELLGWEVPDGLADFGGYSTATKDGRTVAGLMPKMDPQQPGAWTTYLATDDIGIAVAKVRDAGGQVIAEPMAVADLGHMAVAVDVGGAFFGLWQAGLHTGFQLANEPGAVIWTENYSRSLRDNLAFYASVAGWEYDDMSGEGYQYAAFKVDDHLAGGIGQQGDDTPADVPPGWSVYFDVADTDLAVETVRRLGGAVLREPWDTEFGRMASVTDDQGAAFMLMAG